MLFYEYSFIFVFLPLTLLAYYVMPRRARNAWLFVASCVFYASSSLYFLPVLLFSTVIDYRIGRRIHASEEPAARKAWLFSSVALNLGILGFFKYSGLITSTLREAFGLHAIPLVEAPLPIGISFYTFQSMSYSLDLYRRQVTPTRSFLDFGAYITMFPQLIAGPIVRFSEINAQLRKRVHGLDRFADGLRFFVIGLSKKILIADTAADLADPIFGLETPAFWNAWISVLLFSIQIYFDFSGYSDMAVGLGKMLGFEFPQNFNSPYKATSFADFWRRWHMTLSRWLKDNLYIPLGGSRKGPIRTYVNLIVTMLLGGIWHGAGWNYLIWGMYHGALLALERVLGERNPALRLPPWLRTVFVFACVSVGWVFFKCEDFGHSARWFHSLFLLDGLGAISVEGLFAVGIFLALIYALKNSWDASTRYGRLRNAFLTLCFAASVLVAYGKGSSPFLYFRF